MNIGKWILLCFACFFTTATIAETTSVSSKTASTETFPVKTGLIDYLDSVLSDAGFSDETRNYLVSLARTHLSTISSTDVGEKKRLLQRNLYIFLNTVSESHQTPTTSDILRKEYFLSEQYPSPWDYILSKKVLNVFKSNHIFDKVTIKDIEKNSAKFCQVWPFCQDG